MRTSSSTAAMLLLVGSSSAFSLQTTFQAVPPTTIFRRCNSRYVMTTRRQQVNCLQLRRYLYYDNEFEQRTMFTSSATYYIKKIRFDNRLFHSKSSDTHVLQQESKGNIGCSPSSSTIDSASGLTIKNYVFGYGSLMCPLSRQITNANLMNKYTIPIIIHNLQRIWCARTTTGYTAMGVQFVDDDKDHHNSSCIYYNAGNEYENNLIANQQQNVRQHRYCTGVLIGAINDEELYDLDQREASYDRLPVPLHTISTIPFIEPSVYCQSSPESIEKGNGGHEEITSILHKNSKVSNMNCTGSKDGGQVVQNGSNITQVKVWVYVPKRSILPDPSHPILQSYVDIIIRGCFNTYGIEFARSFIETTVGWSTRGRLDNNKNTLQRQQTSNPITTTISPSMGYWVNDRDFPMYKRADRIYSKLNAGKIDDVLFKTLRTKDNEMVQGNDPNARSNLEGQLTTRKRIVYDPILHLEELSKRAEEDSDSVHPMAFLHFISRINNYSTPSTQQ